MKVRAYVLVGAVALVSMSFGSKEARPTEGLNPGDIAPRIEFLGDVNFQNHSEQYTLLNFWATYDATSRARNVQLSNKVNKLSAGKVAMYSVSFDENESVFTETVRLDRLNGTTQFREALGKESDLFKKFGLEKGYKSLLLNEEGVIVAVNVTPDNLTEILKTI